ncbi:hypothetical protein ACR776_09275 [Sphingobacterium spiritivorum]|uniref:hypothetical protein n=1 Tax=Sphingobacterium spiritivorum TaxID=258 RepID=UPI003DA28EE4
MFCIIFASSTLEAMDTFLIPLHSIFRWLVLASILYSIGRAYTAYKASQDFSAYDNQVRHWTATITHIQLIIGMVLYIRSPVTSYLWKNINLSFKHIDIVFYGLLHPLLMLLAVVVITIGSALAKRQQVSRKKYKTMLIWFSVALVIIFLAIPWPFSFLSQRPYIRGL